MDSFKKGFDKFMADQADRGHRLGWLRSASIASEYRLLGITSEESCCRSQVQEAQGGGVCGSPLSHLFPTTTL